MITRIARHRSAHRAFCQSVNAKLTVPVNVLADWCQRGVRVIAVTQQIDLSGPAGHLIASLLFGIAEIELAHVKERQAIGIALARKRGVSTRQNHAPVLWDVSLLPEVSKPLRPARIEPLRRRRTKPIAMSRAG
jgi:DNA invertase Pin-like site-specific DNA recombinase